MDVDAPTMTDAVHKAVRMLKDGMGMIDTIQIKDRPETETDKWLTVE